MNSFFLHLFQIDGETPKIKDSYLSVKNIKFEIRNDIPRFTPDISYSTGNFSKLRDKHSQLQLDSVNGTNHRRDTLIERTGWSKDFFKDKLILECGCGAGPDTEILVSLGAKVVAVDIAGVDIAKTNLKNNKNVQFVQDSIDNLHLKKESFDIVFCHRVLQHTPNPEKTLDHILSFVKKDGAAFVHSYSDHPFQKRRWKYFLLPLTNKMPSSFLYNLIRFYSWPAFYLTNFLDKFDLGRRIAHIFIPFFNYRNNKRFKDKSNAYIVEYGVHDTFDALSPRYDSPLSSKKIREIADKYLTSPYDIFESNMITLLRTKVN